MVYTVFKVVMYGTCYGPNMNALPGLAVVIAVISIFRFTASPYHILVLLQCKMLVHWKELLIITHLKR